MRKIVITRSNYLTSQAIVASIDGAARIIIYQVLRYGLQFITWSPSYLVMISRFKTNNLIFLI